MKLLLIIILSFLLLPKAEAQIDLKYFEEIGDIQQHIWISAEDTSKPILLFLHGGPGRSVMPFADEFNDKLKQEFILVHWDQREAGRTKEKNPHDSLLSLTRLRTDTYEVIQHLLGKFGKEKLFLVSHSWSSFLGFHIASKYPQLLNAYIPISASVNQESHTQLTVKDLQIWARKEGNTIAMKELEMINIPISEKEDLFLQQKWLFTHNGVEFESEKAFKDEFYGWMGIWFPHLLESFDIKLDEEYLNFKCPIYFIEGNADNLTTHSVIERYYKKLKAPKKRLFWFTNSGHTVFNTEPEKLQKVIISISKDSDSR